MDVVFLARIQFAANITFHILFPSISIALGWVLLFFRLKHLRATDPQQKLDWLRAYRLWTKIFALTFALGVVWLCITAWAFATGRTTVGYVLGGVMSLLMLLLATVHFCIVSEIVERVVGERGRGVCDTNLEAGVV